MSELWHGLLLPYLLMVAGSFLLLTLTRAVLLALWRAARGGRREL